MIKFSITMFTICYLSASFINLNSDFTEWDRASRVIFITLTGVIIPFSIGLKQMLEDIEKQNKRN